MQSPAAAGKALRDTAGDVLSISQQLVPVDKGDLKASGGIDVVSNDTVLVGYGTDHSIFQEYGTSRMAAQSYLRPAFMQAESSFRVRLAEEAKKLG